MLVKDIEVIEFEEIFAEEVSYVIERAVMEVNSKDYDEVYVEKVVEKYNKDNIMDAFKKRDKVFIAVKDNVVVGVGSVEKKCEDAGIWELQTIYVNPSYHKQGIGRLILETLEAFLIEMNARKILVHSTITGSGFYFREGYNYHKNEKN